MQITFRPFGSLLTAMAAAFLAVFVVPATAQAHFLWATIEGNRVRFALLENIGEKPSAQFTKYVDGLSPSCGGKALTLGPAQEGARFADVPAGQTLVVAESTVGVMDRGGDPYLLIYDIKGAASLGAAETLTKAPAEVVARKDGDALVVSVHQEGWPTPKSDVWVQWPGGKETGPVQTDVRGEARVPWTVGATGGFVGVRAMVRDVKAGKVGDKAYPEIHRWATLTFPVQGATPGDKPFTRLLRESFGTFHDVVSNAAFNNTLFDGKLTRAQLIVFLQQRALIHNELHRILIATPPTPAALYGPEQKNVLVLLFNDLITMGSGWPTDTQARPSTRAFLDEIRASEAKGPYFALGVMHVYYGGITNGGRTIGEKIEETLHIPLTYYSKSDGYMPYLKEVDKISDPEARKEMMRGGQAAYKYIIAAMNEDVFKAK